MTGSQKHEISQKFWQGCTNSYLAADDYYQRQEEALRKLLKKIAPLENTLDIGCGDGRFTMVISEYSRQVCGIDLSPMLIEQAEERLMLSASGKNTCFKISSIEELDGAANYDLVSCMGVTSALVDEAIFDRAVANMAGATCSGGHLLLKDTLSLSGEQIKTVGNYVAIYRDLKAYRSTFLEAGFSFDEDIELMHTDGNMVNHLFLLTRQ